MKLIKSDIFYGRLINPKTGDYSGKCVCRDNKFWYQYSDRQQIRKDNYIGYNRYYL